MTAPELDRDDLSALGRALQRGDEGAYRALFDLFYDPLLHFAASLVRDPAVAEDLVQEAFVRVWDRREQIDVATSLRAYLYRIVRNLAFNHRRDDRTRQRLLGDVTVADSAAVPRSAASADDSTAAGDLAHRLSGWVDELPPRQREALLLSRVQGLSHAEVAQAMGCAARTVNNHLVAALSTLKRRLLDVGTMVASLVGLVS